MRVMLALGLLWGQLAVADAVKDQFCQPVAPDAIQRMVSLPQGKFAAWWPEFFEEKTANGSSKLYAGVMCSSTINVVNEGNCIVDLQTGKITQAPGFFDGQWTKDHENESIYTIPNKYSYAKGVAQPGLSFYRYKDVLARGGGAQLMYRDPAFGNHYHSFGVLARGVGADGRKFVIHRAMNDKWGVSIKDYKFILSETGETIAVQPAANERNMTNDPGDTEVVRTAPVGMADPAPHNSFFDLPMISPDGKFFAANNRKTMTTQIFEITDSGKRLVSDLGIETGKVSIAPRRGGDMYVAFHIDQLDPAEGDKMTGVHLAMTKDIVVMRLAERKDALGRVYFEPAQMVRVTDSGTLGNGNYYPKWINENELVFIESKDGNRQTFVKADVRKFNFKNNLMPRPGAAITPTQYAATTALGYYVANVCTNFSNKVTAKESALYSMVLTKENCLKLAQTWDQWRKLVENSGALYDLRAPKSPGAQRVSGWNFHESSSRRGAERFEKPVTKADVAALTPEDLRAVCELL